MLQGSQTHNICLNVDSYKVSMWKQYPPGTENVYSYIESRGGKYEFTLFFGLQAYLKEYLSVPVTKEMVEEADKIYAIHGEPFNKEGWMRVVEKHGGFLPLVIKAIPEGLVVPTGVPLVTVENTDPEFFWLTTWVETSMLRAVWYPTTVATQSWAIKMKIKESLMKTGDVSGLSFKLHDFGARGVSSFESAGLGGAAHLVNFMGTDTVSGILALMKYYNALVSGFSIPAAEHSTVTSWGKEDEVKAYRNMLTQFAKPGSLVAVVSDSYDIYNAAKLWGTELKQQVIDSGATVVIRPDSGDPATVVTKLAHILDEYFGSKVNDKGYKVLNHVRIIQGDGVDECSIRGILMNLEFAGFSADNIAFGMGGALLQKVDRDTQKFAMKCSAVKVNGEWRDVFKDPVTDSGKKSKRGRVVTCIHPNGDLYCGLEDEVKDNLLEPVWENGKLLRDMSLEEIRNNSEK